MSTPTRRLVVGARLLPAALLTLALATPAAAQFGGLKKKIKAAAGAETGAKGADSTAARAGGAAAPTGGGGGGAVVLDEQVVGQLIAGLKAGQAEREAAKKENNSYGRYHRDVAAYEAAKIKCQEAQGTFATRAAADEKFSQRYTGFTEKMIKAQQAGDNDLVQVWSDSALAMMDPSCLVKQPKQPDDYYDAQREIDNRGEQAELKGSGLSRSELAMAKERAYSILLDRMAPGDASASEKAAVNSKAAELKPLMGLEEAPPARAKKAAPAPAPAPAPTTGSTQPGTADQSRMANCMAQNAQKHEKEIQALAQRAQAAQQANDMNKLMAIADSIQKLQSAGCR
jgi:hypothetical protein